MQLQAAIADVKTKKLLKGTEPDPRSTHRASKTSAYVGDDLTLLEAF